MPKFSITFSRKRWEHLVKEVEADNLEAAEKMVSGYMQDYTFAEEDWDAGELVGVYITGDQTPEIEITNTSDDTQKFYPEDYCWPDAEPAPLPPPPPPPNKKFVVRVSREVTTLQSANVEVEAPDEATAIAAAQEFNEQVGIALEYEMQVDDGRTNEYEVLSEADLEKTSKEPPS